VGDSLIWGQGLHEADKFYTLTAEWLRESAFGERRTVDLKVKAHSGSTLKFQPKEAEKYKTAGRDETFYYNSEVNVGFPSTWKQVEVAAAEYRAEGDHAGADIIMLTGGITDISVSKVLDPFGDNKELAPMIEKYCRDDMSDVLEHIAKSHPGAMIVVIGYYPIISPRSSGKRVFNGWLESMSFPGGLKPLANNAVTRKLFFGKIRKKAIERSRIWIDKSNKNFQFAVDNFNTKQNEARAVFVRSPITEETCLETKDSLLFRMGKNGVSEDSLAVERSVECRKALRELKRSTAIEYSVRHCEIAGVGHPDPAGARAYAESIKTALAPLLRPSAR
jgi:lysophospholipase L1-like esterase